MIKYKVVTADRRSVLASQLPKELVLKYKKGKVVKAKEFTFGIMIFKRRYQAERFIEGIPSGPNGYQILRVQPIGRGKKPPFYVPRLYRFIGLSNKLLRLITKAKTTGLMDGWEVPDGTICYSAVVVLN